MSEKRHDPHVHTESPTTYPEVNNPAIYSALDPRRPKHPFDGDEHGHERHDTIPAEEEWVEEDLDPEKEHNPRER